MSRKNLEGIVEDQGNHVKHFDPLEAVSHHIVFIIFLSMLFLVALFMFFMADPATEAPTAYAIVEFEPITIHQDIANAIGSALHSIRQSEDRPLLMLALYTFWIIVFGLINMVIYERHIERRQKK
jgi:hypothetical protein